MAPQAEMAKVDLHQDTMVEREEVVMLHRNHLVVNQAEPVLIGQFQDIEVVAVWVVGKQAVGWLQEFALGLPGCSRYTSPTHQYTDSMLTWDNHPVAQTLLAASMSCTLFPKPVAACLEALVDTLENNNQ